MKLDDVAGGWSKTSSLTPVEEKVLGHVFWRLLGGQAVSPAQLTGTLGLTMEDLDGLLDELATKRCLRRARDGSVVAARGLMVAPSRHRLSTSRGTTYTQCAIDAIGIPAALDLEATVEDRCAWCEQEIVATVRPPRDVTTHPGAAVIVMASAECTGAQEIPTMCQETNLFCSPDHARSWQRERGTVDSALATPVEAAAIGREPWARLGLAGRGAAL